MGSGRESWGFAGSDSGRMELLASTLLESPLRDSYLQKPLVVLPLPSRQKSSRATTMKVVLQFCANSSFSWTGWCNGDYVTSCLDFVPCSTWDCPRGPLRNRNNLLLSLYSGILKAALVAGLLPNAIEVANHNYKALNGGESDYTQACSLQVESACPKWSGKGCMLKVLNPMREESLLCWSFPVVE